MDSITISGKDEVTEQIYSFDYHSEKLPHINSLERDYWGYYNNRDSDKILPSVPWTSYEGANLNPHPDKILAGSLKRIHYPTGGHTEFEFEANQVLVQGTSTPILETVNKSYSRSSICEDNHNNSYYNSLDVSGVVYASIDVTISFPDIPSNAFGGTHPKDVVTGNFVRIDGAGSAITADGSGYQLINGYYKHDSIVVENQTFVNQDTGDLDLMFVNYRYICSDDGNEAYGPTINIKYDRHYGGATEEYYNAPTGGLRIKKITNVDENEVIQIKEYNYNNENGNSSGKYTYSGGLPTQSHKKQEYWGAATGNAPNGVKRDIIRVIDHSYYDLGITGSIVCYGKVTETIKNTNNDALGKTEFFYDTTQNNVSSALGFPFAPLKDESHKRILKSKKIYASNNNLVLEETYNNTFTSLSEVKQLLIRGLLPFFIPSNGPVYDESKYILYQYNVFASCDHTDDNLPRLVNVTLENNYSITNAYIDKKETVITQYDSNGNNPVTTTSNQFYGSSALMTQSDVLDSRNGRLRTKYFYPQDIPDANALAVGGAFSSDEYNEILLLNSDRPSAVVQTENYRSTNPLLEEDDGKLLSAQRTVYDKHPYLDVQENIQYMRLPKTVKTLKGVYNSGTNPLIDRVTYHDYDDKGNPLEVSKTDGTHISYIWGYNKTYPVAKIENAIFSNIPTSIYNSIISKSNTDDDTCLDPGTCDEKNLRIELNKLRNTSLSPNLSNAMITTYTYDPLIGITSMTDPKGYTIYYTYDDLNRLKWVKDANGNILSQNEYNYKQ